MKKLLLALLFVPLLAFGNPIDDKCPQFVLRGAPVSKLTQTQYICKTNYAIHYRYDTKTPEYVVEHVTREAISGPAKRKDDFRPDPDIPKQHQSQLSDYAGQPYDRGHLAPGANNTQNDIIMSESFFLSNMMLQRWTDHNGEEHRVLDDYERNCTLIDLNAQPDAVKATVDAAIREQLSHKDVGMVGAHFMKFCGKYELTKLSDQADTISRWLNETYKGVLNDTRQTSS